MRGRHCHGRKQLEHCIKGSRPDAAWKGGQHRKKPGATAISTCAAAVTTTTCCNRSCSGRCGSTATAATACNGCCCWRPPLLLLLLHRLSRTHDCHRGSNSASAATAAGCEARLGERQVSDGRLKVRAPALTCLLLRAHAHNLPRLVCSQVGNGPRQSGTHAIRVLHEAQFALTYSIVLAVLAH